MGSVRRGKMWPAAPASWRRRDGAAAQAYKRVLISSVGNRDFTTREVVHHALQLPSYMHGVCNYGGFIWSWSRVTIFQRRGTWVCGEGTSRIFGPKATSAVMLSQWENGALLFAWILTIKRFVLFQRYNMIPNVQSILYTSQSDSLRKHESLSCENRCK